MKTVHRKRNPILKGKQEKSAQPTLHKKKVSIPIYDLISGLTLDKHVL